MKEREFIDGISFYDGDEELKNEIAFYSNITGNITFSNRNNYMYVDGVSLKFEIVDYIMRRIEAYNINRLSGGR